MEMDGVEHGCIGIDLLTFHTRLLSVAGATITTNHPSALDAATDNQRHRHHHSQKSQTTIGDLENKEETGHYDQSPKTKQFAALLPLALNRNLFPSMSRTVSDKT
jgi:hypothetical protein